MKTWSKCLLAGVCVAVAATSVFLFSPAYARYTNVASTTIKYDHPPKPADATTLSVDTAVYDFGVWTPDVEEMTFEHTLRLPDVGVSGGVLRFSWDDETRSQRDVAVYIESTYYTAVQNSGYTDYTVSAVDGDLTVPFSLIFANPTTQRVATLDVSWYPAGSVEPTHFARYLLAVVPEDRDGSTAPSFVEEDTHFMTNRLLRVAVNTPSDSAGVQLAPAEGSFAAYTRYRNDAYPQGVTLVRDSALYIQRTGDRTRLLMDLSTHLTDNDPLSLTVGISDTLNSILSRTPLADTSLLTVSSDDEAYVVSATKKLTITLTESSGFRDSDWATAGSTPVDLTWTLQQKVGNTFVPVTVGENLVVDVTQTATGGTFTVSAPDGKQAPGTYLLTVTQHYYGDPILETPIWFFIDYR